MTTGASPNNSGGGGIPNIAKIPSTPVDASNLFRRNRRETIPDISGDMVTSLAYMCANTSVTNDPYINPPFTINCKNCKDMSHAFEMCGKIRHVNGINVHPDCDWTSAFSDSGVSFNSGWREPTDTEFTNWGTFLSPTGIYQDTFMNCEQLGKMYLLSDPDNHQMLATFHGKNLQGMFSGAIINPSNDGIPQNSIRLSFPDALDTSNMFMETLEYSAGFQINYDSPGAFIIDAPLSEDVSTMFGSASYRMNNFITTPNIQILIPNAKNCTDMMANGLFLYGTEDISAVVEANSLTFASDPLVESSMRYGHFANIDIRCNTDFNIFPDDIFRWMNVTLRHGTIDVASQLDRIQFLSSLNHFTFDDVEFVNRDPGFTMLQSGRYHCTFDVKRNCRGIDILQFVQSGTIILNLID